ncbi:MAG: hypothetical protein GF329_18930 [Candidatus Lokiarchaeota archaeon]|nr:hypothetical protein [Candidatus Lokiarchaeota archaeon]
MRKKSSLVILTVLILFNFILMINLLNPNKVELLNKDVPINEDGTKILAFKDDFEDGSLGTDWTLFGYGGVGTHTSNSGSYSAYTHRDTGNITSKEFDFSSCKFVYVEYWVQKGDDDFSEDPDGNEDFWVQYYSKTGAWITIDEFLASDPDGEIYEREHRLPTDACHSNFKIRFYQLDGTYSSFYIYDYWHFDDVKIYFERKPNLYAPNLYDEKVTPLSGASNETYNFTINYKDLDNNSASIINCIINDTYHPMTKVDSSDNNYKDGVLYEYLTPLPDGKYFYHFEASDGKYDVRYPKTGELTGPVVSQINFEIPKIKTYGVSPQIGHTTTDFIFSVKYSDQDNNPPSSISVNINGEIHPLEKVDYNDLNFIDGCFYQYITKYSSNNNITYHYNASDGVNDIGSIRYNDSIQIWEIEYFNRQLEGDLYSFSTAINDILLIHQIRVQIIYPDNTFEESLLLYNRITRNDTSSINNKWDWSKVETGEYQVNLIITDISGNIVTFQKGTINKLPSFNFLIPVFLIIGVLAIVFAVGAVYINRYEPKITIKSKKKRKSVSPEKTEYKRESIKYIRETRAVQTPYEERSVIHRTVSIDHCPYCNNKLSKSVLKKIKNGYRVNCPSNDCRHPLTQS